MGLKRFVATVAGATLIGTGVGYGAGHVMPELMLEGTPQSRAEWAFDTHQLGIETDAARDLWITNHVEEYERFLEEFSRTMTAAGAGVGFLVGLMTGLSPPEKEPEPVN